MSFAEFVWVCVLQLCSAPHAAEGSRMWWQSCLIQTYPPSTEVAFRVQRGQKFRWRPWCLACSTSSGVTGVSRKRIILWAYLFVRWHPAVPVPDLWLCYWKVLT